MNNEQLKAKVISAAYNLMIEKGYIAPVELFIKLEILTTADFDDWRFGRIPYLEKVCKVNLGKMSFIMSELRRYGRENKYKSSLTVYKKWGKGNKIDLRFSKSGDKEIEKQYSTHFVKVAAKDDTIDRSNEDNL